VTLPLDLQGLPLPLLCPSEGWVLELLRGHPEWIHSELGVHYHIFSTLIAELQALGHSSSTNVSIQEQLAIFLYSSVTGLTIRHAGKCFQRSNETISQFTLCLLLLDNY